MSSGRADLQHQTVLSGPVVDQPVRYGVLNRLRDLGLLAALLMADERSETAATLVEAVTVEAVRALLVGRGALLMDP